MARKNQRMLWYSVQEAECETYVRDKDGNVLYEEVDGEMIPIENCSTSEYSLPVPFVGTIQSAGGSAEAAAYGVSVGSYSAKLLDVDGGLPLKEMSLIWLKEPQVSFNEVDTSTADYRVVSVPIPQSRTVYLLKRNE